MSKTSNMLTEFPFSEKQCKTLFQAVLVHDDYYPDAKLPQKIHLTYSREQFYECYQICLQIWQQGIDRKKLMGMMTEIYRGQSLQADEQLAYKFMRAKFKHLRFAFGTFDESHKYPALFHYMIAIMGYLQDSLKNHQTTSIKFSAILLRLLLNKLPFRIIVRKIYHFKPNSPDSFRKFILMRIHFIRLNLAKDEVTSKIFHEMRIVISQQVALYDNFKILYPSKYHNSISEYLSTLNGMMGGLHDELIAKKFSETQNYYQDTFKIPPEIRQRLQTFTDKYDIPD